MLGEDVANITIAGKDKQVYDVKQFLAKIKGGYSFTIKNAEGSKREYKLMVNTPWKLSMGVSTHDYEPAITIDDVPQQNKVIDNVAENSRIKVVFNGIPAKKKLIGIKTKHNTRTSTGASSSEEYELTYSISGNSVEFVMPRMS